MADQSNGSVVATLLKVTFLGIGTKTDLTQSSGHVFLVQIAVQSL